MAMSTAERARRREDRKAAIERRKELIAEAIAIVKTGKCPFCGSALRRNLALSGWWQCSQYGAVGFRADANKPQCEFQTFTE